MATIFHLVRHGAYGLLDQGVGGRNPYPLSEAGRAQATAATAALRLRPITRVVSSPVQRALQTAAPISSSFGLTTQIDPAFAEIDFAAWTGARFAALASEPAWQRWNNFRSTAGVPGGETILAVQMRAVAGLTRLAGALPNDEIVIVSHSDVIKTILVHVLGSPLDLMRRIEISAGSISEIVLYEQDAKIVGVNLLP
jgi:broad specificity phosphatase PhoE